MSNNQQQPAAGALQNGASASWDEARIEEAMRRLKMLHVKERNLRDTVPKIIDPLIQNHATPEVMFQTVMQAVNDAQAKVNELSELVKDDATRQILEQARKRRAENPDGIKPWLAQDYPDWYDETETNGS